MKRRSLIPLNTSGNEAFFGTLAFLFLKKLLKLLGFVASSADFLLNGNNYGSCYFAMRAI
jgi:hypothetical protein